MGQLSTSDRWSTITRADVQAWATLTNLLAQVEGTEEFVDPEDLTEVLQSHGFTPELDSWAVWNGTEMVAFGELFVASEPDGDGSIRVQLDGGVHPDHQGRGLGRELMDRLERRGSELAAERHPGRPVHFRAPGRLEGNPVRPMLEHRGYHLARYFHFMKLELPAGVATQQPPLAEGWTVRNPEPGDEEAVRRAHNAAFADHWGSSPMSAQRWRDFWSARSNRFDVSTVVLDAGREVVAYVLGAEWVPKELYISILGAVPSARGRGLARHSLARTIALASAGGRYRSTDLHVDSASPTGATRLYEAVGYAVHSTSATYLKALQR